MVDMGFLPAVRRLLDLTPSDRQMLLFSATLGREVETLVQRYQRDPARHDVGDDERPADVTHHFWSSARERRLELTARLVREHGRALVFCKTRRGADRVARQLTSAGVSAAPIHGDRTQAQRERALAAFAAQQTQALVATDVAARGIHVDELPCVVHFDPPNDPTDYLHRSGRTGRAGNVGTVVSLVTEDQHRAARGLQRALGLPEGIDAVPAHTSAETGSRHGKPREPRKPVGVISFVNTSRGFGFVSREQGSDLFLHHTNVVAGGFLALVPGQRVEFVVGEGRRGPEAREVRAL